MGCICKLKQIYCTVCNSLIPLPSIKLFIIKPIFTDHKNCIDFFSTSSVTVARRSFKVFISRIFWVFLSYFLIEKYQFRRPFFVIDIQFWIYVHTLSLKLCRQIVIFSTLSIVTENVKNFKTNCDQWSIT